MMAPFKRGLRHAFADNVHMVRRLDCLIAHVLWLIFRVWRLSNGYPELAIANVQKAGSGRIHRFRRVSADIDKVFREVVSLRNKFDSEIGAPRENLLLTMAPSPTGNCFSSKQISVDEAIRDSVHLEQGYRDEAAIKEFVVKIRGHTMVPYDGLATLANQVRHCEEAGIEGDFVELGTWKGGCLGIMALANCSSNPTRRVH